MEVKGAPQPPNLKVVSAKIFLDRWRTKPLGPSAGEAGEYGEDFRVSYPKGKDYDRIASGNFEITNFSASPQPGDPGKNSYHFYVGETEFFVKGKAADEVDGIQEELRQEALKPK